MSDSQEFKLTIVNGMEAFRLGLIALIPSAEIAGLTWRDENTHDDWERLAESLFDVLIAAPIRQDSACSQDPYPLPRYDFNLASYEEFSWLEVDSPSEDRALVFLRLLTREEPFDTAQFVEVAPAGRISADTVTIPFRNVEIRLRRRFPDGSSRIVREVSLAE